MDHHKQRANRKQNFEMDSRASSRVKGCTVREVTFFLSPLDLAVFNIWSFC